jgi:hypothetical protein
MPDSAAAAVQRFHSDSSCIRTAVVQIAAAWARRRPHRRRQSSHPPVRSGKPGPRTAVATSVNPGPSWLTTATTTAAVSAVDRRRHRRHSAPWLKQKTFAINNCETAAGHKSQRQSNGRRPENTRAMLKIMELNLT